MTKKFPLRTSTALLIAFLFAGCSSTPPPMRAPPVGQPLTSTVRPGTAQHPTVSAVQRCLAQSLRLAGSQNQLIIVERVDSEATNSTYGPGLPQPHYSTYVTQVLSELGFRPLLLSKGIKASGNEEPHYAQVRPDMILQGTIVGYDALVAKWRDARDVGIGFGKGRGNSNFTINNEDMVALGQVTATVLLSVPKPIATPARPANERVMVFPVTATGSATAEFKMAQSNTQSSASVVIGFGAGQARERVNVVDVQSAALYAVRMSVLLALAQQFNVTTPVCAA
jgi:hypothetical protein